MGLHRIPHPDHDPDLPEKHPVPLRFHRQRAETTTVFDSRRLCCIATHHGRCLWQTRRQGRARRKRRETKGSTPRITKTKKAKSRNTHGRPSIRDTQAAALVRALKPTQTRRIAEFRAAHKDGIDALKRHDPATLEAAVIHERNVIDVVSTAIQQARTRRK